MKTLQQYEADLAVAVPTVTLLGQLGYDDDDLKRLRDALRPLFRASVPGGLKTVGDVLSYETAESYERQGE